MSDAGERHRVVVGGGFGGLQAVRSLRRAPVEITLIDRRNFHLFQPLLYQVATGALSPAEIATPLRVVLPRQKNVRVVMGDVREFDLAARRLLLDASPNGDTGVVIPHDTLVVAAGSRYSYFGHDEWRTFALNPAGGQESHGRTPVRAGGQLNAAELDRTTVHLALRLPHRAIAVRHADRGSQLSGPQRIRPQQRGLEHCST